MLATCLSRVILVSGVSAEEYSEHSIYAKPSSVPSSGFTQKHDNASRTGQLDENPKSGCEWVRDGIMFSSSAVFGFVCGGIGFAIPFLVSPDCPECYFGVAIVTGVVGVVVGFDIVGPYVGDALAPDCNKEIVTRIPSTFDGRKQQLVQGAEPVVLVHTFRW